MGEAVWNLISSVYQSNWDSLIADKNSYTLRQKISVKFTPKVKPIPKGDHADKSKSVPACIERIPPPIPAKSQKEVNQISKYFQNIKWAPTGKPAPKSYAQASTTASNTEQIIKIKNTFPFLGAKKIQNIVKGSPKPKPRIQMTTKGPSRKQVIIPMNGDNIAKFMKESLSHVANINIGHWRMPKLRSWSISSDQTKPTLQLSQTRLCPCPILSSLRNMLRMLTVLMPLVFRFHISHSPSPIWKS